MGNQTTFGGEQRPVNKLGVDYYGVNMISNAEGEITKRPTELGAKHNSRWGTIRYLGVVSDYGPMN